MFNDLMENIEWFFNLHDKNKDGYLTKDEVLTLSESLLVRAYKMLSRCGTHPLCSSSSGSRLGMRTWALSAGSCPMRSSTAMHSCRDRRAQILKTTHLRT